MATGLRRRVDLQFGELAAPLNDTDVEITFTSAPSFPTLAEGEYVVLILSESEIVHLTDYAFGDTSGTIERAQEGTLPLDHPVESVWEHGPTAKDFEPEVFRVDGSSGTATRPSISFANDSDLGWYRSATNQMSATAGGEEVLRVGAVVRVVAPLQASNVREVAVPDIAFTGDADTGFYSDATNSVAAVAGGSEVVRFNTSGVVVQGAHPLLATNGTLSAPSVGFSADPNTGMYRPSEGVVGFVSNGDRVASFGGLTERLKLAGSSPASLPFTVSVSSDDFSFLHPKQNNGFVVYDESGGVKFVYAGVVDASFDGSGISFARAATFSAAVLGSSGTAASPSFSFSGAPDMGLYRDGSALAFSQAGTRRWLVNSSGDFRASGNSRVYAGDGGTGSVSFGFDSDVDTGMFREGSGSIGFSANGTEVFRVDSNGIRIARDGNKTTPSLRWTDSDHGLFSDGALDRIAISVDNGALGAARYSSVIVTQTALVPGQDNVMELGNGTFRWDNIWATNGSINTSDLTTKSDVWDSDLGLSFIRELRPIGYVRNGGARPHYGFGAQEVRSALDSLGVSDFAGYIDPTHSLPDATKWPEAYDEDGNPRADALVKGLRLQEFIGPLTRAVQELAESHDAVVDRLAELEAA